MVPVNKLRSLVFMTYHPFSFSTFWYQYL